LFDDFLYILHRCPGELEAVKKYPLTLPQDLRVGNKYRIGRKIGSGSFGDIYLGMIATLPMIFTACSRFA
jgi:hypothetical protein